ncbi:hypothetical protein C0995_007242 [Termitomyces sp. Mi166|nr:hypothetical protein C0995_007242 [Termitomyces sp. Mi166\
MASLPVAFSVGSASSGRSVRDAIASYRRAQYFVAGSQVTAASDTETFSDDEGDDTYSGAGDEEANSPEPADQNSDDLDQSGLETQESDLDCTSTSLQLPTKSCARDFLIPGKTGCPQETTPLLRKAYSTSPQPRRLSTPTLVDNVVSEASVTVDFLQPPSSFPCRLSTDSAKSVRYYGGQSTFGQTLFNTIAILLGIGMLSEPLAFTYSGAKILARIILSDPRLRSYADIGRKAFGQSSTPFISVLFCLELFSVSVVLVTLYADSLHTLIPSYSTTTYKLWGLLLLIPTIFLPLSLLSYTSILGILSSILIIFVVLIDGFCKSEAPGSLWRPAETNFGIQNSQNLGLAFGLFMAGFSGHAVIPSLARDMKDPSQFDRMINWAFFVATMLYTLIGYAGYRMFGNNVSEELNATIEILLGIDVPLLAPEDIAAKSNGLTTAPQGSHIILKRLFAVTQRVMITILSVTISILVPNFGAMMALLGSFAAFALCLIGPLFAKVALTGHCSRKDGVLLAVGVVMAAWGMVAAASVAI